MTKPKATLAQKRSGPKGLGLGPMIAINGRGTPAQHDKFLRLGGSAWLRASIDAAKMPKKR